jgi:ligand-binding sensor domain-containing protein
MDRHSRQAFVFCLSVCLVLAGSCDSQESVEQTVKTQTASPVPSPSVSPTSIPTPTSTPWPTRIPQENSNCPAGGWTLFSREDELAESHIKSIAAGPDGVIWAADYYGKIYWLYDGSWSTLPLDPIPIINVILPLETGGIWVGTQGGQVSLIDGYDRMWTSRVVPMEKGGTAVYDLAISPQGHLWAATWDGLFELWGEDWSRIPNPVPEYVALYSPKSLYFDQKGGLWVGARHSFNYYFQGGWSGLSEGLPELVNTEDIVEDSDGRLWFGTLTGAFVYYGETWERIYPVEEVPHGILQVESLAVDHEGGVWLVSSQETVVYQDGSWQPVLPDVGSPELSISSVEVDPWGALWFVSSEGVLCYLP